MERPRKHERVRKPKQPDYQALITEQIRLTIPDIDFPAETIHLMSEGLLDSYRHSGEGQRIKRRKSYHNDEHQYEVFVRTLEWLQRFEEYLKVKFSCEDWQVAGVSACYHDNVVRLNEHSGGATDEELSFRAALKAIEHSTTEYSDVFKSRVEKAILATTVDHSAGIIEQTKAMVGQPDHVAIALALADAGAVLTEDIDKIISDVSKLSIEGLKNQSPDDNTILTDIVMKILSGEETFIKQRFEDLEKYLSFLMGDSAKASEVVTKYFDEKREYYKGVLTELESKYDDIRESVQATLDETKGLAERSSQKIHSAIMRGLDWLH